MGRLVDCFSRTAEDGGGRLVEDSIGLGDIWLKTAEDEDMLLTVSQGQQRIGGTSG